MKTPERPCGDIEPVLAPERAAWVSGEMSFHLEPAKAPKTRRKRGPCADRRSQQNKVGWLAGKPVQIGPVSDRYSLLTGENLAKTSSAKPNEHAPFC